MNPIQCSKCDATTSFTSGDPTKYNKTYVCDSCKIKRIEEMSYLIK